MALDVDMAEVLSTRYDYFSSNFLVVCFFKGSKVEMKMEAWCAIRADLVCKNATHFGQRPKGEDWQ